MTEQNALTKLYAITILKIHGKTIY